MVGGHALFGAFLPTLFVAVVVVVAMAVLVLRPTRIRLGGDAVEQRCLGTRMLHYACIAQVSFDPGEEPAFVTGRARLPSLRIQRRSGPAWHFTGRTRPDADLLQFAVALRERLAVCGRAPHGDETVLARSDLEVAAWGKRLRNLLRIAENPADSASDRVAAVVALSSALEQGVRERLKLVRESTLLPTLRRALDASLADDEAELEAALHDVANQRDEPPTTSNTLVLDAPTGHPRTMTACTWTIRCMHVQGRVSVHHSQRARPCRSKSAPRGEGNWPELQSSSVECTHHRDEGALRAETQPE